MSDYAGPALRRQAVLPPLVVLLLVVVELQALSLIYDYQTGLRPACLATFGNAACSVIGFAVPRALGAVAALVLFAIARPQAIGRLLQERPPLQAGFLLHVAGVALLALPGLLLSMETLLGVFGLLTFMWIAGAALAALGGLMMIAQPAAWRRLIAGNWMLLATLACLGMVTPELAEMLRPLWRSEALTDVTFGAVVALLDLAGYDLQTDPGAKVIGTDAFSVAVSSACSGVEGFALITLFLSIYLALFRQDIAFPAAFLLFPIGIAASWILNVLRISILLVIGLEGAPELAVGGFHSRAGWLAFTLLAFGLIFVSRRIPLFRRDAAGTEAAARPALPFLSDPTAAALLPFAVFMFSAHVAGMVSETPGLLYPWRALAMAATVALFWRVYRALPWRLDPVSIGCGLAIGVLWAVTSPPAEGPPPFGALAGAGLWAWIAFRVVGTGVLVPLIEEMLFRGYLLDRLAPSGRGWPMAAAILVSAVVFAVLHDRWLAAFLSGLVFGALVARSGRVTDAVVSHAAANLLIAGWAIAAGDWSII